MTWRKRCDRVGERVEAGDHRQPAREAVEGEERPGEEQHGHEQHLHDDLEGLHLLDPAGHEDPEGGHGHRHQQLEADHLDDQQGSEVDAHQRGQDQHDRSLGGSDGRSSRRLAQRRGTSG